MLVITRKEGESILIGDNILINIVEINKGQVRIAVDAPREISILRKEIVDEVKNANINASVKDKKLNINELALLLKKDSKDKK